MDPLIDQLTAPGHSRVGAPFLVIPDPSSVPVASTEIHEIADRTPRREFLGSAQGWMIPVIKPDAHDNPGSAGGLDNRGQLFGATSSGLLDQRVLSGRDGCERDLSEHVVRGGDDDGVDIRPFDQRTPFGQHQWWVGNNSGQGFLAPLIDAGASDQRAISQRACTLPTHEATPDDADLHLIPTPCPDPWARCDGAYRCLSPSGRSGDRAGSPRDPTQRR